MPRKPAAAYAYGSSILFKAKANIDLRTLPDALPSFRQNTFTSQKLKMQDMVKQKGNKRDLQEQ